MNLALMPLSYQLTTSRLHFLSLYTHEENTTLLNKYVWYITK